MGQSISLPELEIPKPAVPPTPDALSQFQRASQLQTQAADQQAIQAQTTGQEQQNQAQALALKDEQLRRSLAPQYVQKDENGKPTGFDYQGLYSAMLAGGADPKTVQGLQMSQAQMQSALIGLSDKQLEHQDNVNDKLYSTLESVRSAWKQSDPTLGKTPAPGGAPPQPANASGMPSFALPNAGAPGPPTQVPQQEPLKAVVPPEAQAAYQQGIVSLAHQGIPIGNLKPVLTSYDDLDQAESGLALHKQQLNDAKEQAATAEAAGKGAQGQAEAEAANWKGNDGIFVNLKTGQVINAGGNPTQQAFQEYIAKGGDPLNFAAEQAQRELPGKLQLATAEERARQAISDGDPNAAAKLLVDGTVAPSQLISSRKPAFAQQAFSAAAQMQPGWNATKADADYKVASSPANLTFFGSAKSLTDPGGTLDQLAAAAKDIPQSQIPVFNSFADAAKAALVSGPVAKYAALLTGVADDYSKVMGGGQGSDASRNQGISLVPAKASPEQRAAAIEGIRGAVTSQARSRIGNNQVLDKMYGENIPKLGGTASKAGVPTGATHIVPGPDGKNHYTNDAGTTDYGVAP